MKNVPLAIVFLAALLVAGGAKAEDKPTPENKPIGPEVISIDWLQTGVNYGMGFMPKVAADGCCFADDLGVAETGTGFSALEGWKGIPGVEGDTLVPIVWCGTDVTSQIGHAPSAALFAWSDAADDGSYGPWQDDLAIEVYQGSQSNGTALWYRLGSFEGNSDLCGMSWAATPQQYDQGYNPSIAVDHNGPNSGLIAYFNGLNTKGTVVEVHQAGDDVVSPLWYHVGTLSGVPDVHNGYGIPSLTLGPATEINFGLNQGNHPTVSIADNLAILVAEGPSGALWYSIGVVNPATSTIAWSAPEVYDSGYAPSISVYGSGVRGSGWTVVEVHQQDHGTGPLLYRTGILSDTLSGAPPASITWTANSNVSYSIGCYPSVALSDYLTFTPYAGLQLWMSEVHGSECGAASALYFSSGVLLFQ